MYSSSHSLLIRFCVIDEAVLDTFLICENVKQLYKTIYSFFVIHYFWNVGCYSCHTLAHICYVVICCQGENCYIMS